MHIQADVLAEMISNKYHIRKNKVSAVMRNFFNTCSDNSITDVYPMSIKRIYVDF